VPAKNEDLHGSVPDEASVALLLIDVINDLEFEYGAELLEQALPVARRIAALKKRARESGVPVIYANDNFGRWQSDFQKILSHCIDENTRGRAIAEILRPEEEDYFVLKPKHSAFYSTTLDTLLDYLRVDTLVIAGMAADVCVLFTANDAYMRDFDLVVPEDTVASWDPRECDRALRKMKELLKADTTRSDRLDFEALKRKALSPRDEGTTWLARASTDGDRRRTPGALRRAGGRALP
jgi:nicotinamidase-related amidase